MIKTLLIGDLHFGKYQSNEKFLKYQLDYLKEVQNLILKENIKKVIQLGDSFDNRFSTSNYVLTEVKEKWFNWFTENKIELVCIMGNHDQFYKNEATHSPLFTFASKYVIIVNDMVIDKEHGYIYNSYNSDITNIIEDNVRTPTVEAVFRDKYLFGHFDIIGFKMNNTREADSGYSKDIFKYFKKVYSGHYHSPSELDNIKYIGSPFQLDFNNFDEAHGVYILDNDKEIFIENKTSPKFIDVNYRGSTDITISGLGEDVKCDSIESALEVIKENYCKLIIRHVDNQIKFQNFKDKINIRERINLEVLSEKFSTDKMLMNNIKDIETLLKEFFTNLSLSDSIQMNPLMKFFFKYYNQIVTNKDSYNQLTDELKFKYVEFTNFLSYQNTTRIDFENGMSRLIGENGAGKTSAIIEAINFGLFGSSLLGKNKPSLVNNVVGKKCLVKTEFFIGTDIYYIERGIKPNVFKIYKNDVEEKELPSVDEYQKILNSWIGITPKQLQYLLLKNKKIYKPFSTLSTPEKREFIEKMFNLDVFSEMLELIKLDLSQNKIDIDLTWKDIQKWEELIAQEEKHIEKLKLIEEQQINKEIDSKNKEITNLNNDKTIISLESNLSSQRHILNTLRDASNIKSLESEITHLNASINTLRESGKKYLNSLNEQIKEKKEIKEFDSTSIDKKIDNIKNVIGSKKTEIDSLYVTLKSMKLIVDDTDIEEFEIQLKDLEKQKNKINSEFQEFDSKITENKTKIKEAENIISKMSEVCKDCIRVPEIQKNYNIPELKSEIELLKSNKELSLEKLAKINNDEDNINLEMKKISELQSNIKYSEDKLLSNKKELINSENNLKELIEEKEKMISEFNITKSKIQEDIIKLSEEKEKYIDDVAVEIQNKKSAIETKEKELVIAKEDNEKEISTKEIEIESIEASIKEHNEKIKLEIDTKKYEIERLEESKNNIIIDDKELNRLTQLKQLDNEKYEDQNNEFNYLEFLRKMLMSDDSIKSYIIGQYMDFINYEFNMNLSKFNVPFVIMFDKNLNQEFMGDYSELGYNNLSSGEEKAIDFALMFTWDTLQYKLFNRKINVVVFDEILSGLDSNKTRIAFEELKKISADKSVWIVEHLFEYDVDKTYLVTKDENGSKITLEK